MKTKQLRLLGHFLLFLGLLLFGCTRKSKPTEPIKTDTKDGSVLVEPEILFLQLKVSQKNKESNIEGEIVNKRTTKGLLDKPLQGIQLIEGRWLMSFLDAEKKVVAQEVVPDPIYQVLEYLNEKGKLDNTTIVKKEADCFIRVQNAPNFRYLKCEMILENKQLKQLFQIAMHDK
jgi:hypothetical protein